jgi:hypothetical protein
MSRSDDFRGFTQSLHTNVVAIFQNRQGLRSSVLPSFLPLGTTAEGKLWPPEQSASIRRCDG